jgi:alkyl hydroperoxide reductase subunit F
MLTHEILQAVKGYTANMQKTVTFVLQTGEHSKRAELLTFLTDISKQSDHIHIQESDMAGVLRSPISFLMQADGVDTGIRFSGIPSGHEFNSLILAILHALAPH